ncbi:hypothetical protein I4300191C4_03530 [Solibaculum mannosilyticum]
MRKTHTASDILFYDILYHSLSGIQGFYPHGIPHKDIKKPLSLLQKKAAEYPQTDPIKKEWSGDGWDLQAGPIQADH